MFPFIDMLFGTFYLPKGKLPLVLGIGDEVLPPSYVGQIMHPFKKPADAAVSASARQGFDVIAAAVMADHQGAAGGASSREKTAASATMT